MTRLVGLGGLLLVALSGTARAESAVIVGGGGTEQEATEWLGEVVRRNQPVEGALIHTIAFAEQYPRVEKSELYPGLKSGPYVVVFGVCETGLAKKWAKALKAADIAGVTTRSLPGTVAAACPGLDEAKVKSRLVLRRPAVEAGDDLLLLRVAQAGTGATRDQAAALLVRAGALLDVWVPPAAQDGEPCPAKVDRLSGQVQVECAEHVAGDNCFDVYRGAFELSAAAGTIKAKPLKRKRLRRDCAE